ncbi:MAG: sodium:solute symporter [Phycisphaerales bacterium]|jgi:SSS family solute:Na+ symporter|nr:sodium:solute symporter [Phycisphaerales bacterium]
MGTAGIVIFVALFALVTIIGFIAANWRKGDLDQLHEWGLGGRRFGTIVSWFLLGGDLYTAYTLIAVPALVFGAGAVGFFALPYALIAFIIGFVTLPKLWDVAHKNGYVTAADFVQGHFQSRTLGILVAITAIFATLPYLALQLVGMEVALAGLGLPTGAFSGDLPLIVAFLILAAYTYSSGLRAPAAISLVKDALIYVVIIAAAIVIPMQLGGYGHIFDVLPESKKVLTTAAHSTGTVGVYMTLALGSALALFLYPHATTGIFAAKNGQVVRRNMALLPIYTVLLGFVMMLGYMAYVADVQHMPQYAGGFKAYGPNYAVVALFLHSFPGWFAGIALAAIAIGALVPAAVMSIAAANLFARNLYLPLRKNVSAKEETLVAKLVSLGIKVGAIAFILLVPVEFAIQFQLLGGIWIIQLFPALMLALYIPWMKREGLIAGWVVGTALGTWMAAAQGFTTAVYPLHLFGWSFPGYAALYSLVANLVVTLVVSVLIPGRRAGTSSAAEAKLHEVRMP